jgi:hypothetical protein
MYNVSFKDMYLCIFARQKHYHIMLHYHIMRAHSVVVQMYNVSFKDMYLCIFARQKHYHIMLHYHIMRGVQFSRFSRISGYPRELYP